MQDWYRQQLVPGSVLPPSAFSNALVATPQSPFNAPLPPPQHVPALTSPSLGAFAVAAAQSAALATQQNSASKTLLQQNAEIEWLQEELIAARSEASGAKRAAKVAEAFAAERERQLEDARTKVAQLQTALLQSEGSREQEKAAAAERERASARQISLLGAQVRALEARVVETERTAEERAGALEGLRSRMSTEQDRLVSLYAAELDGLVRVLAQGVKERGALETELSAAGKLLRDAVNERAQLARTAQETIDAQARALAHATRDKERVSELNLGATKYLQVAAARASATDEALGEANARLVQELARAEAAVALAADATAAAAAADGEISSAVQVALAAKAAEEEQRNRADAVAGQLTALHATAEDAVSRVESLAAALKDERGGHTRALSLLASAQQEAHRRGEQVEVLAAVATRVGQLQNEVERDRRNLADVKDELSRREAAEAQLIAREAALQAMLQREQSLRNAAEAREAALLERQRHAISHAIDDANHATRLAAATRIAGRV